MMFGLRRFRWVQQIEDRLEHFGPRALHGWAIFLAALSAAPPIAILTEFEFEHQLHAIGLLVLTPILSLAAKIVIGAAFAKHRNWWALAVTLIVISSGTLACLALAKLAGVKISL